MKQPDLGRKIAELRLAKGLTQAELAEMCNVSQRTIQRIESTEVTPRSVTVRLIFSSLDYTVYNPSADLSYRIEMVVSWFRRWPGQFYTYVLDLFNLKTNAMRKIIILSFTLFIVFFGLSAMLGESKAQPAQKVHEAIAKNNENFKNWFNDKQIDQLMQLYRYDACILAHGCGKEYIRFYFESQMDRYEFSKLQTTSISVADSIAVEKGKWEIHLESGESIRGEYLTEWRKTGQEWLIVNESSEMIAP